MSIENKIEIKSREHVVTLHPSITFEQDKNIMNVYLDETLNRAQLINKAEKQGIETVVYSLDGSTENIYDRFLKLPLLDSKVFMKAIKEILDPKAPVPETKSE